MKLCPLRNDMVIMPRSDDYTETNSRERHEFKIHNVFAEIPLFRHLHEKSTHYG